jgi:DNA-binding GntR family transcriptional regulator
MEFIKIDKSLQVPYHIQLANSIRSAILNGNLQANSKLPTEEELGVKLNLSRPVIRQAYKQLNEDGLIYRLKAKGSFVLPKEERLNLLKVLLPLTEKISLSELSENIVELEHSIQSYNPKTMPQLLSSKTSKFHVIKRLYYGERRSMFYIEIIHPEQFCPRHSENNTHLDANKQIHRNIFAIKLDDEICKIFNVPVGSAGFKIISTCTNSENSVTEISTTFVQGYNVSIILDYFKQ